MSARLALAILGTVLAWLPFLGVLLSSLIADALGCTLNEAAAHPCIVLGVDIGGALVTGFVLGWLMLVTWPVMMASLVGWPIWAFRRWWARR
ncbi:hypothetical protein ACI6QG_16625 [Roseococcus sp. DSY-14]|uniref:hypothetical protein n=1 Tax=Roseococcus sp. DSY-14 TaxID=3369650 RepID=UPI00387B3E1A